MVGAGDEPFELVVADPSADAAGQESAPMRAGVGHGRDLVLSVPEEHDLFSKQDHCRRLALDAPVLHRRIPVLPVSQLGYDVVDADAGGAPRDVPASAIGFVTVVPAAVAFGCDHFSSVD